MTGTPTSPLSLFLIFTRLGLTSFGGPIAHLGYFREEFVGRRRWFSDEEYADLVALAQFLPGPASSQVGFAIGLQRGGQPGGLAAWLGFTWPSALLMFAAAFGLPWLAGGPAQGLVTGLKVAAVAVVAHAVLGMARSLCPDRQRGTIALVTMAALVWYPSGTGQLLAIAAGLLAGLAFCRTEAVDPVSATTGWSWRSLGWLALFFALLFGLPAWHAATQSDVVGTAAAFYRAGALVFGGGHVVLPLLEASVVPIGWVSAEDFLAGYGAAQAIPGPLFTFAAFLGGIADNDVGGWPGALIGTVAVFLPGSLLVLAVLPAWNRLRGITAVRSALAGVNAAVVGILGAALYDPIWTSTIRDGAHLALALLVFASLAVWRWPAWVAVVLAAVGGQALGLSALADIGQPLT